jgi:ABC-2 type transport system permease protein
VVALDDKSMHIFKIFLLYFQDTLTDRSRSFVWLLLPIINAGLFLIFWHAAFQTNNRVLTGWDSTSIIQYYLLMIISGALLVSHIEDLIQKDIQQGELVKYLLKPFPYYTFLLFQEIPYRILQGFYAISAYLIVLFFFPIIQIHVANLGTMVLLMAMFICSFFLIHTYKTLLGMITFWTKDVRGFKDTSEVVFILFTGFSVPLDVLPGFLQQLVPFLPFSYFIYYPILGVLGKLSFEQLLGVFGIQLFLLGAFVACYKIMLAAGLKKFTAVGQ